MGNVIKSINRPSTPTAVLYSSADAQLVTDFLRSSPVPLHQFTFRAVAFVLLPNHDNLPPSLFRKLKRFEKEHSNVYWIFAVRKHEDILEKVASHSCQVITISEVEVNEHFGDYKQCTRNHRRVLHSGQNLSFFASTSPTKYPKHARIEYAVSDRQNNSVGALYGSRAHMVIQAYEALNNTLIQQWSTEGSDSLLLDRRVDVILGNRNVHCWSKCSFYPYALYAPNAARILVRRARPLVPSFASTWESFFCIPLVLAPVVVMILLAAHIQRRFSPNDASPLPGVIAFLVSTYLGRSPPPAMRSVATSSKITMATWMFGMLFLINFIQTEITSSRAVPEYSSEIRNMEEFVARIESGARRLCVNTATRNIIRRVTKTEPRISHLDSLDRVLEQCGQRCVTDNFWTDCAPKICRGTHMGIIMASRVFAKEKELVPGQDTLLNSIMLSPAHGSFPLRHQHRRLVTALIESGIFDKESGPHTQQSTIKTISVDVPFVDYLTVYFAGCGLASLSLFAEIAYYRLIRAHWSIDI
ncbi:hypothetical protein HPB50_013168 [Hyalomma asiaticum]|uniref:Uncharacterized protein n=1 Tax=Hyalomma asiaticum TaxID=266040 RepID=A0ACB7S6J7_HYAAI|nr:hypothetical protein HPB50_013168 [Hyalomma asiaticum]